MMRGLFILAASLVGWAGAASAQDVTSQQETVASVPAGACGPGSMVVRAQGGRVRAASVRAQGVEILAMDPATGTPSVEARFAAGGLSFFKVVDGVAVVGTRNPGGLHQRKGASWTAVGLPPSASVVDLLGVGTKRYALLATSEGGMVARTGAGGTAWEVVLRLTGERPLSLLPLAGEAYVFTSKGRVYVEETAGFSASKADLFPRARKGDGVLIAHRPVKHGGETLYLASRLASDGTRRPAGLFAGTTPHNARRIILHGMKVRDILSTGKRFFALATSAQGPRTATKSTKVERYGPDSAPLSAGADAGAPAPGATPTPPPVDGGAESTKAPLAPVARPTPAVWSWVVASTNLVVWEDILAIRSSTPARSFAQVGGDFYLSVGCDPARPRAAPARVVRIKARHWKHWRRAWIY